MKDKDKVEAFFRTADASWWNPDCAHDNRFWLFKAQSDYIRRQLVKRVNILHGAEALDAGCGRGIHSLLLSDLGCDVTSLDINPEMLRLTSEVCDTRRILGSIIDMPFHDESFDIVVSIGTTMHVSSLDAMMSEVRRVMRKNSIVVISIANKFSLYVLWTTKLNRRFVRHQDTYHRRQSSHRAFRRCAHDHGFAVLDSAGFASIPPISWRENWCGNVVSPYVSKMMSLPFDWLIGRYLGCGVTFILKKT